MPHISRGKINPNKLQNLYLNFLEIMSKSTQGGKNSETFDEFLTQTEKVMLTKRFAIITLLTQKVPIIDIAEGLSVSPATVEKISLKLESGKFKTLEKYIGNKKDKRDWASLEEFVLTTGGLMPPITGHSRLRELKKLKANKTK